MSAVARRLLGHGRFRCDAPTSLLVVYGDSCNISTIPDYVAAWQQTSRFIIPALNLRPGSCGGPSRSRDAASDEVIFPYRAPHRKTTLHQRPRKTMPSPPSSIPASSRSASLAQLPGFQNKNSSRSMSCGRFGVLGTTVFDLWCLAAGSEKAGNAVSAVEFVDERLQSESRFEQANHDLASQIKAKPSIEPPGFLAPHRKLALQNPAFTGFFTSYERQTLEVGLGLLPENYGLPERPVTEISPRLS
jgi:hypothetical protein